ncbi:MAG: hypothetical protein ACK4PR_04300, partial [Gammaproteobacteria bacterium]
ITLSKILSQLSHTYKYKSKAQEQNNADAERYFTGLFYILHGNELPILPAKLSNSVGNKKPDVVIKFKNYFDIEKYDVICQQTQQALHCIDLHRGQPIDVTTEKTELFIILTQQNPGLKAQINFMLNAYLYGFSEAIRLELQESRPKAWELIQPLLVNSSMPKKELLPKIGEILNKQKVSLDKTSYIIHALTHNKRALITSYEGKNPEYAVLVRRLGDGDQIAHWFNQRLRYLLNKDDINLSRYDTVILAETAITRECKSSNDEEKVTTAINQAINDYILATDTDYCTTAEKLWHAKFAWSAQTAESLINKSATNKDNKQAYFVNATNRQLYLLKRIVALLQTATQNSDITKPSVDLVEHLKVLVDKAVPFDLEHAQALVNIFQLYLRKGEFSAQGDFDLRWNSNAEFLFTSYARAYQQYADNQHHFHGNAIEQEQFQSVAENLDKLREQLQLNRCRYLLDEKNKHEIALSSAQQAGVTATHTYIKHLHDHDCLVKVHNEQGNLSELDDFEMIASDSALDNRRGASEKNSFSPEAGQYRYHVNLTKSEQSETESHGQMIQVLNYFLRDSLNLSDIEFIREMSPKMAKRLFKRYTDNKAFHVRQHLLWPNSLRLFSLLDQGGELLKLARLIYIVDLLIQAQLVPSDKLPIMAEAFLRQITESGRVFSSDNGIPLERLLAWFHNAELAGNYYFDWSKTSEILMESTVIPVRKPRRDIHRARWVLWFLNKSVNTHECLKEVNAHIAHMDKDYQVTTSLCETQDGNDELVKIIQKHVTDKREEHTTGDQENEISVWNAANQRILRLWSIDPVQADIYDVIRVRELLFAKNLKQSSVVYAKLLEFIAKDKLITVAKDADNNPSASSIFLDEVINSFIARTLEETVDWCPNAKALIDRFGNLVQQELYRVAIVKQELTKLQHQERPGVEAFKNILNSVHPLTENLCTTPEAQLTLAEVTQEHINNYVDQDPTQNWTDEAELILENWCNNSPVVLVSRDAWRVQKVRALLSQKHKTDEENNRNSLAYIAHLRRKYKATAPLIVTELGSQFITDAIAEFFNREEEWGLNGETNIEAFATDEFQADFYRYQALDEILAATLDPRQNEDHYKAELRVQHLENRRLARVARQPEKHQHIMVTEKGKDLFATALTYYVRHPMSANIVTAMVLLAFSNSPILQREYNRKRFREILLGLGKAQTHYDMLSKQYSSESFLLKAINEWMFNLDVEANLENQDRTTASVFRKEVVYRLFAEYGNYSEWYGFTLILEEFFIDLFTKQNKADIDAVLLEVMQDKLKDKLSDSADESISQEFIDTMTAILAKTESKVIAQLLTAREGQLFATIIRRYYQQEHNIPAVLLPLLEINLLDIDYPNIWEKMDLNNARDAVYLAMATITRSHFHSTPCDDALNNIGDQESRELAVQIREMHTRLFLTWTELHDKLAQLEINSADIKNIITYLSHGDPTSALGLYFNKDSETYNAAKTIEEKRAQTSLKQHVNNMQLAIGSYLRSLIIYADS